MPDVAYEIGYGKRAIPVYRVQAAPLRGVTPIPESPFTGSANHLFAVEVDVEVLGDDFLPAYTHGDNRLVVATDSMKNFVLRQALAYDGATLEGFLHFLGAGFVSTYAQLRRLRLTGRELPFVAANVPDGRGGFVASDVLFEHGRGEYATATLAMAAEGDDVIVTQHECGLVGLRLMKLTGSAFTSFVRDDYTTLPERRDRPLYVFLDVGWRYADAADLLALDPVRYVPAEQVRDLVRAVFHRFVSESIQHLVHEMGARILERFPQLAEVSFVARNRTRDPVAESATDPGVKVYSDPFPAFGEITLRMTRAT
jgi:urate oxidase